MLISYFLSGITLQCLQNYKLHEILLRFENNIAQSGKLWPTGKCVHLLCNGVTGNSLKLPILPF